MGHPQLIENMFSQTIAANGFDGKERSLLRLPLNLIALIVTYIEQPRDLARICRTCRVLHYMALPKLYTDVSIRSYDYIRYSQEDGRPEGCGMASPFTMALNGLVSRNVAGNVKSLRLYGRWKDFEVADCAKAGRVPDSDMLLNCLVRVAVERMTALEAFSWELNTKMLSTVWQGLGQSTVTHLTMKFPSTRDPKPITIAPPIPNLNSLKIYDIDPLCYADDISLLLLESRKLRKLSFCWSPRMREAREPSVTINSFFGRILSSPRKLSLTDLTLKNLYTHNTGGCKEMLDSSVLENLTFIGSVTGITDQGASGFLDPTWRPEAPADIGSLRMLRIDKVSKRQAAFLNSITGLEKVYLIGTHKSEKDEAGGMSTPMTNSPASSTSTNSSDCNLSSLKDEYVDILTRNHGSTLRHLLLMPQWRLGSDDIAKIVKKCPNLEQLGIGVEFKEFDHLRLLVPFLPRLTAIRLLANPEDPGFAEKVKELDVNGFHEENIGSKSLNQEFSPLKWMELADLVYHIDRTESYVDTEGRRAYRKHVTKKSREDASHIAIWGMDSFNV